jgi:hypothetical protein
MTLTKNTAAVTWVAATLSLLLQAEGASASPCYNAWATPTSITYNFTSLSASGDSGSYSTLISTPFQVTFKRTDTDFASVPISNIALPFGRYTSVGLCSDGTAAVTLDGVRLDGNGSYNCSDSSPLPASATVYTSSAANSPGAITTTGPATALTFVAPWGPGCSDTFFAAPLCVTDDTQQECKAGDVVYTGTGAATNLKGGNGKGTNAVNASFKLSLLVDLYDGVVIDAGAGMVLDIPAVQPILGDPGAAIHITVPQEQSGNTVPFNASLLFGSDKSLLAARLTQGNGGVGGNPLRHSCQGTNNIAIPGASASFPFESLGAVSTSANGGLGQVLAPVANVCTSTSTCVSVGTEEIDDLFQAVGESATLQCISDQSPSFQTSNFGVTYVGGTGAVPFSGPGTDTADIVRIVDPQNLFGVCAKSPCVDLGVANGSGGYR